MTLQTARRYSPVFVATITPKSVETKISAKGSEYLICSEARFERFGKEPQTRTVMVFGQSVNLIKDILRVGEPAQLAVQFDGGTIKALGQPRPQQIEANRAAAAKRKEIEPLAHQGGFSLAA